MRTDGQTDMMKLMVAFRSFASPPKYVYLVVMSDMRPFQE